MRRNNYYLDMYDKPATRNLVYSSNETQQECKLMQISIAPVSSEFFLSAKDSVLAHLVVLIQY